MTLHSDTHIYKSTLDLTILVNQLVAGMHRNYKLTLGADLRKDCRKIVRRIYQANSGENRIKAIKRMRSRVEMVNLSLRECVELRLISHGQYSRAIEMTTDIGRQSTGWLKHSENALVAPSSRR